MAKKKKPIPVDKKIEKLIEIYKEAEKNLIDIIVRKKVKGNSTRFYTEMLKQVQQEILRLKIFNTQWATDITKQLYMQAYEEALYDLGISDNTLTQLHKEAIELIAENIVSSLNEAVNLVGRQVEDKIREIGLNSTANKFATGNTIKQMQKELVNSLIDEGLTGIKDKLGRNIPIGVYAETLARSIVAETQNTCVINTAKEYNNDLVKMSQHNGCCPVCATYEGRVFSISGKDTRFPSLSTIPGFNKGYNNLHPKCKHRLSNYIEKYNDVEKDIKNSNRPFKVPKDKQDSVNKYYEEQKKKAQLRANRKQYEKYKLALKEEAPKSFQGFLRMKNAKNQDNYNDLKRKYREVSK